jgi:hypothetical protein
MFQGGFTILDAPVQGSPDAIDSNAARSDDEEET